MLHLSVAQRTLQYAKGACIDFTYTQTEHKAFGRSVSTETDDY